MPAFKKPFQLPRVAYVIVKKRGRFDQGFGFKAKEKRFAREDRDGHSSEYRKPRGGCA